MGRIWEGGGGRGGEARGGEGWRGEGRGRMGRGEGRVRGQGAGARFGRWGGVVWQDWVGQSVRNRISSDGIQHGAGTAMGSKSNAAPSLDCGICAAHVTP